MFILGDNNTFLQLGFFCFFFRHPTFFQIDQVFFYFVALINFSKNRFNVFFLNVYFYRPSSLDFGFF